MKAKTDKDFYLVVIGGKTFEVKDGVIEAEDEFREAIFSLGFVEIFEEPEAKEPEVQPVTKTPRKGKKNG